MATRPTTTTTMLFMGCRNGSLRSVQLLLADARVRVNQSSHDDATGATGRAFQSVTPLRMAAQKGHLEVVRVLVEENGIDLDKPGNSNPVFGFESPLQIARRSGYDAVVAVLLAAGAKDDERAAAGEEK